MGLRLIDGKLWASTLPESPYNTPPATGAGFTSMVTEAPFINLPTIGKTNDAGQMGTGSSFPTHACNDYWDQTQIGLSTTLNFFDIYGRLWLRGFGGAVTAAAAGTGFRHEAHTMQSAEGSQLPGTSVVVQNGPVDNVSTGLVPATMTLSKGRQDVRPNLNIALVGTGNHVQPSGLTGLPAYTAPLACPKSGIIIKYTDPDSVVVDLGAAGCDFVNVNVALNNNLILNDRCPSDPELTMPATNGGTANVLSRVQSQRQDIEVTFTFLLDPAANPEYLLHLTNEQCTNLQIGIKGPLIGAGPQTYEIGAVIPKFQFLTAAPADDNGFAAFTVSVIPNVTAVPADLPLGYVINEVTTNFK